MKILSLFTRLILMFISFAAFFATSLITYFVTGENGNDFKLGFPFMYYEQFQLRGNILLNFGWDAFAAIYDYMIVLLFVLPIVTLIELKNKWRKLV